jgi:hypothetical protein
VSEDRGAPEGIGRLLGSLAAGWLFGGIIATFAVGLPEIVLITALRQSDGGGMKALAIGGAVGLLLCLGAGAVLGRWRAVSWTFAVGPPLFWVLAGGQILLSLAKTDTFGAMLLGSLALGAFVLSLGFWLGRVSLKRKLDSEMEPVRPEAPPHEVGSVPES